MDKRIDARSHRALTVLELLVAVAVIATVLGVFLPVLARTHAKSARAGCHNNVKQIGLAFRTWEGDFGDRYPMSVPDKIGGAMESCLSGKGRHAFEVMSNELNNPTIILCPNDNSVTPAANLSSLTSSNVSYFVGIVPDETLPGAWLSGDLNIAWGVQPTNGVLNITTKQALKWTSERHHGVGFFPDLAGNIGLADGSVQQVNSKVLNSLLANSGLRTNRIALP